LKLSTLRDKVETKLLGYSPLEISPEIASMGLEEFYKYVGARRVPKRFISSKSVPLVRNAILQGIDMAAEPWRGERGFLWKALSGGAHSLREIVKGKGFEGVLTKALSGFGGMTVLPGLSAEGMRPGIYLGEKIPSNFRTRGVGQDSIKKLIAAHEKFELDESILRFGGGAAPGTRYSSHVSSNVLLKEAQFMGAMGEGGLFRAVRKIRSKEFSHISGALGLINMAKNLGVSIPSEWTQGAGLNLPSGLTKKSLLKSYAESFNIGLSQFRASNKTGALRRSGFFNKITRISKGGVISAALAGSLLFGTGTALADNLVPVGKKISVIEKTTKLRSLTDYIAGITEKSAAGIKNVSDLLYETSIHESMRLGASRQIARGGKPGIARSIFMIEPVTAKNLVNWARNKPKAMSLLTTASGKTAKELSAMTRAELADFLMAHDHFGAAMARVKYMSVPGKIPSTREARAAYWSKYYQGTSNPVKEAQYLRDSRLISAEVKAAQISRVVVRHLSPARPVQGLVNRVLHEGKTGHAIKSVHKKIGKLLNMFRR
jgi:hypothetical protein